MSSPQLQRRHWTADPESNGPSIHPQIPNPVVCLVEGDVILFQLQILPHSEFCPSGPPSCPGSHPSPAWLSSLQPTGVSDLCASGGGRGITKVTSDLALLPLHVYSVPGHSPARA